MIMLLCFPLVLEKVFPLNIRSRFLTQSRHFNYRRAPFAVQPCPTACAFDPYVDIRMKFWILDCRFFNRTLKSGRHGGTSVPPTGRSANTTLIRLIPHSCMGDGAVGMALVFKEK